ncbi:phosphomannomutase/phosphoglucomutase [Brachybacterium sp. JHP9]|uniref:Phosphomannomutase/phosphoglucomutase n=1 Tax=Brachybacterium equifaecis TaxID=2910770 RepID=A0ABT0R2F4_9MICO|nr:phosphomannomutase/phosphoglucomutase [Brachybacterium equifaecis]
MTENPTEDRSPLAEAAPAPDLSRIIKAYDVRGEAGTELTEEVARALGAAFADFLDPKDMVIAHDMRLSSPQLSRAFADGAVRRGATVAFAGLSSTDQLYCTSGLHQAAGAMFTASHNPAPDNGIKMCLPGARPISRSTGLAQMQAQAEAYLASGEIPEVPGGRSQDLDTLEDYVATVLRLVPVPGRRPLRVVVDAANAMAGLTVPAVAAHLPFLDIVPLYFELDGTFPHHEANPLDPENLKDLQAAVLREGADLGLAFDGDADRCFVVDEQGRGVNPSAITALIAQREIARARAAGEETPAVVANLVSSRHVQEAIEAAGGRRVRSQVGHSLIKALMAENSAVFGGEHSAHYYFRDFFFADSGMLAALHVLAAMEESDGTLSALFAAHDPYTASGEINSRVADAAAARERVRARMQDLPGVQIDDLDGMTVTHWDESADAEENWWFSLRSSNTEPLLRLNVEAAAPETMERVREEVLAIVRGESEWTEPGPEPAAQAAQEPAPEPAADLAPAPASEPAAAAPLPSRADVVGGSALPDWVRDVLRCPQCGSALDLEAARVRCRDQGHEFAIHDGIPVLIEGRESEERPASEGGLRS